MVTLSRASLALFIAGAVIAALALAGPLLGLGANEQFVTYRLLGVSRSNTALLGASVATLALAPLLVSVGWRLLGWLGTRLAGIRILRRFLSEIAPGIAIAIVTLAVIAGVAEAYFRWTVPFIKTEWPMEFDPQVGVYFKPGALVRHTNHVDYWTETRANALGFLDREPPASKPAGTCRIAFLGDSFVEAAQVPIDRKVQVQLEQLLKDRNPGRAFDTVAFGYSGTGQINQLPFYDVLARKLEPDVVVLVVVSNDMANNSSALEGVRNGWNPEHGPRLFVRHDKDGKAFSLIPIDPDWTKHALKPDPRLSARTGLQRASQFLRTTSYFYSWLLTNLTIQHPSAVAFLAGPPASEVYAANLRQIQAMPGYERAFDGWRYPDDLDFDTMFFTRDLPAVFADAEAMTGFALDEYADRAQRDGFRLIVLASASLSQGPRDQADFGRTIVDRGYYARIARLAAARGIPVVDQYAYMIAHGGKLGQEHFSRDGHWSVKGHRWAAEALADYLQQNPAVCGLR